jgi:hypothetical protein
MGQQWGDMDMGRATAIAALLVASGSIGCGQVNDEPATVEQQSALAAAAPAVSPRLIAPLSTSISTSQRPVFQWTGGRGPVALEICRDRACRHPLALVETARSSARPRRPLPPGVVFWRALDRGPGRRGVLTSAVWELTIPARESGRAESWGATPDFNGDGFSDLAVGVKAVGAVTNGEMRIFPGGPRGLAATPAQTLVGGVGFGDESGPAGDIDGDGFGDLAVWSSGPPQTVTIYRGGPAGLGSPVTFAAPPADSFSQMRVLSAGDVNGDGYGDLLVGGGAFAALHLGSATGVNPTPIAQLPSAPAGSGAAVDARWPIGGGDFNGDHFPDAVISGLDGAMLYEGNGQTLVATSPPVNFSSPGFGTLAGDFNGDGLVDLAMTGVVNIGGPQGPITPFQAVAGAFFYQGVGDVNGDGFSDVLAMISSLFGVPEAERVYFGPTACASTECPTFAPLLVPGHTNIPPAFSAVLAGGLGDVNGDGFDDIAYGSPGAGAVYVFLGSAAGPPSTPSLTITAQQGFGFSLARL